MCRSLTLVSGLLLGRLSGKMPVRRLEPVPALVCVVRSTLPAIMLFLLSVVVIMQLFGYT